MRESALNSFRKKKFILIVTEQLWSCSGVTDGGKSHRKQIVILWSSRGTWWVHKMKHDLVTQVEFVLLALRMVRIPEVVARHKG